MGGDVLRPRGTRHPRGAVEALTPTLPTRDLDAGRPGPGSAAPCRPNARLIASGAVSGAAEGWTCRVAFSRQLAGALAAGPDRGRHHVALMRRDVNVTRPVPDPRQLRMEGLVGPLQTAESRVHFHGSGVPRPGLGCPSRSSL